MFAGFVNASSKRGVAPGAQRWCSMPARPEQPSPGASTAVPAMLDVMERCFTDRYQTWLPKLKEMVPSLGTELSHERALFEEVWAWGTKVLNLGTAENPRAAGG